MSRRAWIVLVALAVLCVPSVRAQEDEDEYKLKHFVFRGFLSYVSMAGADTTFGTVIEIPVAGNPPIQVCLIENDCFLTGLNEGSGFQANFEFRATRWLGVEIGATTQDVDGQLSSSTQLGPTSFLAVGGRFDGEPTVQTVYVGLNVHIWKKNSPLDVYVGPFYTDLSIEDAVVTYPGDAMAMIPARTFTIQYEDESTWGLSGGFDVTISKHFTAGASLRYVRADASAVLFDSAQPGTSLAFEQELNPFIFSIGVGTRF